MLNRIKNAYKALKISEELRPEELQLALAQEDIGDGKAEFLGEGTQEEYRESEKERKGFKGIFGL